jgi:hypothetical protein
MTPDAIALVAMFLIGAFVGLQGEKAMASQRRAQWKRRNPGKWEKRGRDGKVLPFQPKADALPPMVPDAAGQLRTVMLADFKAQPLLNKSEARLFRAMDKMVIELAPPGWQVMAQVSLGEILRCEDKAAYSCINSGGPVGA